MLFSEEYYKDLIAKLGLPEMPISKVVYKGKNLLNPQTFRDDFLKISKKLMQFVSYNNIGQLIEAGIPIETIDELHNGIIPENISIYIKKPIEYGGKLEFSNMFLIRTRPFKNILDTFMDEQILTFNREHPGYDRNNGFILPTELYIPNPEGLIFLPALKGFAGAGGNTTADKMSEIGSTMFLKNDGRF